MDKKKKCALKHAVVGSGKVFGFLFGVIILGGAAIVAIVYLLVTGVDYALGYLSTVYPILTQPIYLTEEVAWYMAITGLCIVIVSVIYADVKYRYDKFLKSKECNEKEEF